MNPKTGDDFWNMCKEAPVPVVVCLKPEEEARLAAEDEGPERLAAADDKAAANGSEEANKDGKDGKEPSLPAKEKALTRLGMVMLFNDGGGRGNQNRRAELGVFFARTVRGRGYGTEAIDWLLDRAFMDLNMHKIFLHAYEFNTRALKCYRRIGFREDGRLRDSIWFERRYWDIFNMSVLEDEWEAMRGYKSTKNGKTNGVSIEM
jgi:ribosomal protein S18 acetylase RimI-like enzyme